MIALLLAAVVSTSTPGPVLVLPPDCPAESAWIGEAVSAALPRALAVLGVPAVDREDRLRAHEMLEIPVVPVTRATSVRMAEALGASRIVLGTCALEAGTLSLSLRMLDVEHGTLAAPILASGRLDTVQDLIEALAWDVALAGPVPPAQPREALPAARAGVGFEAFRLWAEGLGARGGAAVRLLRKAIDLSPGFDEARIALARVLLEAREFSAAYQTLVPVGSGRPSTRRARFLQGVAMLDIGRYAEAATLYAGLSATQPSAAVLNNHALGLLRAGTRTVSASDVLRKAVELEPGSSDLGFNLGFALLVEGQAEGAEFFLKAVVQREPLNGPARVALAWALRKQGKTREFEEQWKGVQAMAPTFGGQETPDLDRHFERILPSERMLVLGREDRSDAELAATLLSRAERLSAAGDQAAALRELNRAAYLDPYRPGVHVALGRVYRARGDREKAENELRMALWSRDDPAVRVELAALLKQDGRMDEARAEIAKVLKVDPENAAAKKVLEGGGPAPAASPVP